MATIQSQLKLNDGMTSVLRSVTATLNTCLSSFEQVQAASGRAMDMQAITNARVGLSEANTAIKQMENNIQQVESQQNNVNRSFQAGAGAADNMLSKIMKMAAAVGVGAGLKQLINLSDDMAGIHARLELIVDEGGSVADLEAKIFASAQRSRAAYQTTAGTIGKLGMQAGDAFSNNDELIAFSEQLNKSFAIAGIDGQAVESVMYNLTQALASGVLRGQDLNSVLSNAMPIVQNIADYLGVSVGKIRDMAAEGELSAGIIKKAMFAAASNTDATFAKMPLTWAQVWTGMSDKAIRALQPVLDKVSELANDPQVQDVTNGIIGGLNAVVAVAVPLIDTLVNGAKFIVENWGWIGPIIAGVAVAFIFYNVVQAISTGIKTLATISAVAHGAAIAAEMTATTGLTAAQVGFNAALLACPVTWIILAIIALAVVFVIFTEQIVGAIWWLGALFKNIGLWIANVAIGVWNSIVNVGLWFANLGLGIWEVLKACAGNVQAAFQNTWINIQIGFNTFVSAILKGVMQIIEMLNKIPGVDISTDSIGSSITDFASKKAELELSKKEYQDIGVAWEKGWGTNTIDWAGAWSDGYNTFDVFQSGWNGEAYGAGAEIGKGLHDSMMGVVDIFNPSTTPPFSPDITKSSEEIAANTGSTAASLKNMSEDLVYMRDLAEREAVNRFTTAEIKVDMTGMSNRIDNNMDIDGIITRFVDGVAEALVVTAEGVHA